MSKAEIDAALACAEKDAVTPGMSLPADGALRTRHVAIGDPQAPIETFFAILDQHGLLAANGRLRPEAHLVSMGDHFDWGRVEERTRAAESGERLLAWLTAHPPDQVTVLLGNHDLCRVGELAPFDDATFARAQAEADAAYFPPKEPVRSAPAFRAEYDLPTWEIAARDFSTYRERQRTMVSALLRSGRFRIAYAAADDLLLCHAGVTVDELAAIGVPAARHRDARAVASALNAALDRAVADLRDGAPMSIPELHVPGSGRIGEEGMEGLGMFYHRASTSAHEATPLRRRFPPARLPIGLTQAIGHIRDKKCRDLLAIHGEPVDGPLRHLRVSRSGELTYARGLPNEDRTAAANAATMVFLDGGMSHADVRGYELYDLTTRRVSPRSA